MSEPHWYGRPPDVDPDDLKKKRDAYHDMSSFAQYEKESHYTPKWLCPCGRLNECAVSVCNQCQEERPQILHGDPDQGDRILGLARMISRDQLNYVQDIPRVYFEYANKWEDSKHRKIGQYLFDTERIGSERYVGWKDYVEFLLGGGRV